MAKPYKAEKNIEILHFDQRQLKIPINDN